MEVNIFLGLLVELLIPLVLPPVRLSLTMAHFNRKRGSTEYHGNGFKTWIRLNFYLYGMVQLHAVDSIQNPADLSRFHVIFHFHVCG